MTSAGPCPSARRSFATAIVLWVLAIATVVVAELQSTAFRQAGSGRIAMAQARARWAARAGVEAMIARLAQATIQPDTLDAFDAPFQMSELSEGSLDGARYIVRVSTEGDDIAGPADAHARININAMSERSLATLPFITQDVVDAILDWIDEDGDMRPFGAEAGSYATLPHPYEPRNGPIRSLLELELIAGVLPEYVRGEDWNLNGVLDPNEDDGDESWPPDNADGILDGGWSKIITTKSLAGGLGHSGLARLDLQLASSNEVQTLLNVDIDQAEAIVNLAAMGVGLGDFIRTDLNTLAQDNGVSPDGGRPLQPLSNEQLRVLLAEATIGDQSGQPGKINLNTASDEVLEYLLEIPITVRDTIILDRRSRSTGYASIVDLLEVPGMTRDRVADLFEVADVRSNVYIATSRGRDARSGVEHEMTVTIDRSTLPIVIREVLVR